MRLDDVVGRLRSGLPTAALPALVSARHRVVWRRESVRADAREQMSFLLDRGRPELDLEQTARDYVRFQILRGELRWHPELLLRRLRVVGADHLREARGRGRGVVVNFMHHAYYEGAFASLSVHHGLPSQMIVYPYMLDPCAPAWLRQHMRVASLGGGVPVSAAIGAEGILSMLAGGQTVGIASDVPGATSVRFAGRDVLGSYGAARLAFEAEAPVVVLTQERGEGETVVRVHPTLDPGELGSPRALLECLLSLHEKAVLAWPEAADLPLSRWGSEEPS